MSAPDADEQLRRTVAELAVDGAIAPAELDAVAAEIADLCLVGWDTGGETWVS